MSYPRVIRVALVSILACLPASALAEGYGGCFRLDLAAPFVLPDGSRHEPGTLTICTDRPLNPAAGTHRMTVSGASIGRLVSRRVRAEYASLDAPQAVFARASDGTLRLVGYVEPAAGRVRAFSFGTFDGAWTALRVGHPDWVVVAAK